jgi:hypothetical protein
MLHANIIKISFYKKGDAHMKKIESLILAFLGAFVSIFQIYATVSESSMPLVTRSHHGGLFFNMALPIPYWLHHLGLLGILITLIFATAIESKVISKLLGLTYKKTIGFVFFANLSTGFAQWVLSTCIGKIYKTNSKYFLSSLTEIGSENLGGSGPVSLIMVIGLLFLLSVFCIKMAMQYLIINRYNPTLHGKQLKKSILLANMASYSVLFILEIILYRLIVITTVRI